MFCSVVLCSPLALAQTFEINGQQTQPSATSPNGTQPQAKKGAASAGTTSDNGIGWGSSIEVGRLARAAEDALRHGNPGQAADYAERAVKWEQDTVVDRRMAYNYYFGKKPAAKKA